MIKVEEQVNELVLRLAEIGRVRIFGREHGKVILSTVGAQSVVITVPYTDDVDAELAHRAEHLDDTIALLMEVAT